MRKCYMGPPVARLHELPLVMILTQLDWIQSDPVGEATWESAVRDILQPFGWRHRPKTFLSPLRVTVPSAPKLEEKIGRVNEVTSNLVQRWDYFTSPEEVHDFVRGQRAIFMDKLHQLLHPKNK